MPPPPRKSSFCVFCCCCGVAVATTLNSTTGCHRDVSLGDPNPVVAATSSKDARCDVVPSYASAISYDASFGELRALAISRESTSIAAIFTRPDASGTLALASTASLTTPGDGNAFREVARTGGDPVALAFDGMYAWVSLRASGDVVRIRVIDAVSVVASNQSGATSIAIARRNGRPFAFWTRPQNDVVVTWDFLANGSAPSNAATFPRAQAIASDGDELFIAGEHTLARLGSTDAAPRFLANVCESNPLSLDRSSVFCIDGASLFKIDAVTGIVMTLASGLRNAGSVAAARGRVFFRTEGADGATIQAIPSDGIGGPVTIDVVPVAAPSVLATDGCGLYYPTTRKGSLAVSRFAL